jgi:hypothetical protein
MAGLGEAASVIAVLQIAEDIGLKLFAYTQGVRHAKEDMTRLHSAVLAFRQVLEKVEDLKDHPSAMKLRTFQLLNQPNGPVEETEHGRGKRSDEEAGVEGFEMAIPEEGS